VIDHLFAHNVLRLSKTCAIAEARSRHLSDEES
jgi:hypothetical protein